MIADCFREIPADGLTGAVAAVEGILDAVVLLNGPTGCKFYHGAVCEAQMPRVDSLDPLRYSEEFYFGQPRVPATYLDGDDYVFGATEKLENILRHIAEKKDHALIVVVNSPGAALIGDDLARFIAEARLPVPCTAVENPGFSTSFAEGFSRSAAAAVDALAAPQESARAHRVNLVGVSLFDRYWEGDVAEIRRLLQRCGVTVGAVLCAGATSDAVRTAGRAALNVGIHAELAEPLGRHLAQRFGTPLLIPSAGAPIGFDATERFLNEVCKALGADPAPALADVSAARARAYRTISRFHTITGLPKGAAFAVKAAASTALPLVRWLYEYFGMVPSALYTEPGPSAFRKPLSAFMETLGAASLLDPETIEDTPHMVFAGGGVLARLAAAGWTGAGVEIALPTGGRIDVVPRALLGSAGALHLTEAILNGLNR